MPADPPTPPQKPGTSMIVPWVLWFVFLNTIIVFRVVLAPKTGAGGGVPRDALPWAVALVPALVSTVIRWVYLPTVSDFKKALVPLVLGLVFAEWTCLVGIFFAPSHLSLLFMVSFVAVFQHAPVWTKRFEPPDDTTPPPPQIPRPPR